MALKNIGHVLCPLSDGNPHMVPAGIAREGVGNALHIMCPRCAFNLQVRLASPLGQRLVQEARGSDGQVTGPTAPDEVLGDLTEPHAVEPEATEVAEAEPEPEPARVRARTEDVI